jgi:hypothetical protein
MMPMGSVNWLELFGGATQPLTQVGTAAPIVGGGLAGVGGGVGCPVADIAVAEGIAGGVGDAETATGVLPPQPASAPAASATATAIDVLLGKERSRLHHRPREDNDRLHPW